MTVGRAITRGFYFRIFRLTDAYGNFCMSMQDQLFHEDWRDSMRHVVKALGGYETVGADLWPNKTRKAAGNWLYDCLSEDRPAKLDLEDIKALLKFGREAGCHTAMYFLADETGYERPRPAAAKSPRTALLEKQAALANEMLRLQKEIDRVDVVALKTAT